MFKRSPKYYRNQITKLTNALPIMYPELNFENHCYRRIAYDNVLEEKWSDKYPGSFVVFASRDELIQAKDKLLLYLESKEALLKDNDFSLECRKRRVMIKKRNNHDS